MIAIEQLNFDYARHRALHQINLEIPKGSISAVVGPNGAGKTTLIRCICALALPSAGRVVVDGFDTREQPHEVHKRCGFLADNFGLYERMNVWQALYYYALAHNLSDAESRVEEVIEEMGLQDKAFSPISSLSRGMRQRVGIGQSYIHRPAYLILDEPASGLDPDARIQLADLFRKLNAQGTTLLVSSHILAELDQYANNLIIIKEGRVVEHELMQSKQKQATKKLVVLAKEISLSLMPSVLAASAKVYNSGKAVLEVPTDTVQHEVLMALIEAGIKVEAFYVEQVNLQETYLNTIYAQNILP